MRQIFRINVGPETISGRLPPVRVGKGYCSLFHISGVANTADVPPPKIWVTTADDTKFWLGVWNDQLGLWVVDVNSDASAAIGSFAYALTMFGADSNKEYIAGQGIFTVYSTIAAGGETGGTAGESVGVLLGDLTDRVAALELAQPGGTGENSLESRLGAIETWLTGLAELPMFDPQTARDIEMREQVQAITNKLRGV